MIKSSWRGLWFSSRDVQGSPNIFSVISFPLSLHSFCAFLECSSDVPMLIFVQYACLLKEVLLYQSEYPIENILTSTKSRRIYPVSPTNMKVDLMFYLLQTLTPSKFLINVTAEHRICVPWLNIMSIHSPTDLPRDVTYPTCLMTFSSIDEVTWSINSEDFVIIINTVVNCSTCFLSLSFLTFSSLLLNIQEIERGVSQLTT